MSQVRKVRKLGKKSVKKVRKVRENGFKVSKNSYFDINIFNTVWL